LPDDANAMASDVSKAMLDSDQAKIERLTRIFQDRVAAAIEASYSAAAEDGRLRRRVLQQIGTPRAAKELAALKCALKGRDALALLASRLPLQIGNLASDQLDECQALIEGATARDGELFLYALLTVMSIDPTWSEGRGESRPNSVLDPNEVAEVEALVEFVGVCRYFASELAINEMTQRALSELRRYLLRG
jgi:hypothetical protein